MKGRGHLGKWASGVLGGVCLLLVLNLVLRDGVRAGASRPTFPAASSTTALRVQTVSRVSADELSQFDPVVRLDLLKELQGRPLPQLTRNPFEFEALRSAAPPANAGAPAAPAAESPPPPVPLKSLGYTEKAGGEREALISDDEQIYVVREGEVVAKKYRVLKITPTLVEIEDESSHRKVQLPYNQ